MKRLPEVLVGAAVASGIIFLLYEKADTPVSRDVKLAAIICLIVSLVAAILVFVIGHERQAKNT